MENGDLRDMDKLFPMLEVVHSNVHIQNNYINYLHGFASLKKVGNDVIIEHNIEMNELGAFSNLEEAGRIIINANEKITQVYGFSKLRVVKGDWYINGDSLTTFGNDPLSTTTGVFEGPNKLVSVGGSLRLFAMEKVISIKGFESLVTVGSDLEVARSIELENIDAFHSLTYVGGVLRFRTNDILSNLSCCELLESVKGIIADNDGRWHGKIETFPFFESVTFLGDFGMQIHQSGLKVL